MERGGLLALIVLAVYVGLAPATIVDGDNAEFSSLGALGGRGHPSGYPAYVLYLRLMSWLPGESAAHTAGLATALLAALLVLVLHAACRAWGARPTVATATCAIYAAAPIVLRMHVEAEVFAGNGLVVATVLWLAAAAGPLRGVARGAALGFVAGLGLANHLTCALVAPVGILGIVRATRERRAALPAAIAGLAVGLVPYAYLLVADGPVSYGRVDGIGDILAFVLREDYGGPAAFAGDDQPALPGANLAALVATFGRAWLWLPGLAGVAMLGVRAARPLGETRAGWLALAASFLLAGPLLVLRFNIDPVDIGRYLVQRFHLLPILLVAPAVAAAFEELARRRPIARLRPPLATGLAIAGFLVLVLAAYPRISAQHSPAVERMVESSLRTLPADAVVIVHLDDLCFGMHYFQHVRGDRPDVEVVCWGFLPFEWAQRDVAARGIPIRRDTFVADVDAILARRPVLFSNPDTAAALRRPGYPHGMFVRVLPRGTRPPPLAVVVEENRRLFATFDLAYPRPGPDDDWATFVHARYAARWHQFARDLAHAGDDAAARAALEVAHELHPYPIE